MPKINILPSKVYNRIAAGEVVDRPCSVVKELVENSIDAGATEIEIYIERGGKQLVRVIDNGCGIAREDLQSAYLPHATSKISQAEDLENILTLGFRGEAIASIAAVSKMTITSKTEEGGCYKLSCDGGELGQITECVGERGTEVCVEGLFYHTPVRLGFLKSDKVEETEITNFISRFILNRSDICFTYYADGKKVLQSFGGGDEEAMLSVYGAATLAQCFCLNAEKSGLRIRGYIGNHHFYKSNKSYQSVFLNGRYIVNPTIATAVNQAYASYIMKRQYPFYVLHITMPSMLVDVNVHPNKADVRFADNNVVFRAVYGVINAVLEGRTQALDYVVQPPQREEAPAPTEIAPPPYIPSFTYEQAKKEVEENAPYLSAKKQTIELPFEEVAKEESDKVENAPKERPQGFIPIDQIGPYVPGEGGSGTPRKATKSGAEKLQRLFPDLYFDRPKIIVRDGGYEQAVEEGKEEDYFAANKKFLEEQELARKQNRIEIANCVYVGKLFNTYLIYELQENAYIIDQHAAHERLIFNRLKEQMANRRIVRQPMLVPFELKVNAFEGEFLRENRSVIEDIGFALSEREENTFSVTEIPLDLQNINLDSFFGEILAEAGGYRAIKLENLLKDKLASAACKAAVKGGMDLTKEEIDALFALMDGDMGLKCPHGRPVVVKMSKTELEKMFKRIV